MLNILLTGYHSRPLQNAPFCPIFAFPRVGIYQQASNCNPRNTLCMDACPDGFLSGWLKFSPFLNLNKNEHFSKVSIRGAIVYGEGATMPVNIPESLGESK